FRQYLKTPKPNGDDELDTDVRELACKKNQYGPSGTSIILRWQAGMFLPEPGISNLDRVAREAAVDDVFLNGLRMLIRQGRAARQGNSSPDYAAKLIAELPEAKSQRIRLKDLEQAMSRLLAGNKIHIGLTDGPRSKAKKRVNIGPKESAPVAHA